MRPSRRLLCIGLAITALGSPAHAQTTAQTRIRGVIDGIDATELRVVNSGGNKVTLKMTDATAVTVIAPIDIDAVKPGSFIGTAAVTQPDGTLKALEIQVFPEAMRGVGEGHRPWDLGSDSTMTNGTVGDLKVANGRTLTLVYKGGEKIVHVPEHAPTITYEKGSRSELTPGAHVIVTATGNPGETLTAIRIGVGKDGLVPPM